MTDKENSWLGLLSESLGVSGVEEKMEIVEDTEEEEEESKKKGAKAAAERRKRIMAQTASQQKNLMTENSQLFDETPNGFRERHVIGKTRRVLIPAGPCVLASSDPCPAPLRPASPASSARRRRNWLLITAPL